MMQALGAVPVALPYGQVLTALTTRLIDGAENNWPSYVSTDHYKAARFYTLTEHTMGPEVLIMSRRAWDEPVRRGPRDLPRGGARVEHYMREQWKAGRSARASRRKRPAA